MTRDSKHQPQPSCTRPAGTVQLEAAPPICSTELHPTARPHDAFPGASRHAGWPGSLPSRWQHQQGDPPPLTARHQTAPTVQGVTLGVPPAPPKCCPRPHQKQRDTSALWTAHTLTLPCPHLSDGSEAHSWWPMRAAACSHRTLYKATRRSCRWLGLHSAAYTLQPTRCSLYSAAYTLHHTVVKECANPSSPHRPTHQTIHAHSSKLRGGLLHVDRMLAKVSSHTRQLPVRCREASCERWSWNSSPERTHPTQHS